jgi:hypothetical protein
MRKLDSFIKEFQGFRFADKDPLKWQMASLNPEYMTFGMGRHAWSVTALFGL